MFGPKSKSKAIADGMPSHTPPRQRASAANALHPRKRILFAPGVPSTAVPVGPQAPPTAEDQSVEYGRHPELALDDTAERPGFPTALDPNDGSELFDDTFDPVSPFVPPRQRFSSKQRGLSDVTSHLAVSRRRSDAPSAKGVSDDKKKADQRRWAATRKQKKAEEEKALRKEIKFLRSVIQKAAKRLMRPQRGRSREEEVCETKLVHDFLIDALGPEEELEPDCLGEIEEVDEDDAEDE